MLKHSWSCDSKTTRGHSMLNSKQNFFETMHLEITVIVFYLKAYDNTKAVKNFFSNILSGFRIITI